MKRFWTVAAAGLVMTVFLSSTAFAQVRTGSTLEIDAEVTDGAGDEVTSASYSMTVTVSQTQVGEVTSASYRLDIGFIAAAPPETGPGDLDGDGTVDVLDLAIILANVGLSSTHPSWDPRCDPDSNGACNLYDLMEVFHNWGSVY